MKERPIIMQAESVRAILAGRKTQTRRVVKPQPGDVLPPIRVEEYEPVRVDRNGEEYAGEPIFGAYSADGEWGVRCPYGAPGDRLWVREGWGMSFVDRIAGRPHVVGGTWGSPARPGRSPCVVFRADDDKMPDDSPSETARWSSPMFMPRWASRLTLEVVEVRVQRVQDISGEDAVAEGAAGFGGLQVPKVAFAAGWDSLNAKRGFPWARNPLVWAVTFKRVEGA